MSGQPHPAREQGNVGHSTWVEENEFGEEPGVSGNFQSIGIQHDRDSYLES